MRNRFCGEEALDFSAEELFSIILDVEKYPEFLPWCKGVVIKQRAEDSLVAELVAGFLSMEGKYTSHVSYLSPGAGRSGWIRVRSVDGIFRSLRSEWSFFPLGERRTVVKFVISFSFKSRAMQLAFRAVSDVAKRRLIGAFKDRAKQLFG